MEGQWNAMPQWPPTAPDPAQLNAPYYNYPPSMLSFFQQYPFQSQYQNPVSAPTASSECILTLPALPQIATGFRDVFHNWFDKGLPVTMPVLPPASQIRRQQPFLAPTLMPMPGLVQQGLVQSDSTQSPPALAKQPSSVKPLLDIRFDEESAAVETDAILSLLMLQRFPQRQFPRRYLERSLTKLKRQRASELAGQMVRCSTCKKMKLAKFFRFKKNGSLNRLCIVCSKMKCLYYDRILLSQKKEKMHHRLYKDELDALEQGVLDEQALRKEEED